MSFLLVIVLIATVGTFQEDAIASPNVSLSSLNHGRHIRHIPLQQSNCDNT
jgi:hypothetical protein